MGHTKHEGLDADARIQLYLPFAQAPRQFMAVAVRTAGDPERYVNQMREAVRSADPELPISGVRTMEELIEQSVGQRKLSMMLLSLFSGIALVLASIGIYGVMSYSVTQRSRELGVRIALGARRADVLRLVLRQGMSLALIGIGIGVAARAHSHAADREPALRRAGERSAHLRGRGPAARQHGADCQPRAGPARHAGGSGGGAARGVTTYARRLGLFSGTMAVIGGIIGGGIFRTPAVVAERVGSPGLILAAWIVGGGVALIGAFCFGELGQRSPRAGGGYVYLREAWGPLPAFLYGWGLLLVIASGAIAAVAVTFADYAVALTGQSPRLTLPLAIGAIFLLSAINYVGVRPGAIVQNLFTVLKLAALAALIVAGLAGGLPAVSAESIRPSRRRSAPRWCRSSSPTAGGSRPTSSRRRWSARSGTCRAR